MKKVLIFHHYGGIGGAGLSLLHILRSIDTSQYEVTVACPVHPIDMYDEIKKLGFKIFPMETPPVIFNHYNGGLKRFLSYKSMKNIFKIKLDKKRMKNVINSDDYDIIVVNSMTLFWIGALVDNERTKTICFFRETLKEGDFNISNRIIKNGLNKYFNRVVFISQYDFQLFEMFDFDKFISYDRVEITKLESYNHKEYQLYENVNLSNKNKYILYLGGTSSIKGADFLIKALGQKKVPNNVKLIFLGWDGIAKNKYQHKLKRIIQKYNLEKTIVFREATTNPEDYYLISSMVVFPAKLAHQARPIYESGIAQVPIIIPNFKQIKEFTQDNNKIRAVTYEPNSVNDLTDKINLVLNNDMSEVIRTNYYISKKNHDFETLKYDLEKILSFNEVDRM